MNQIALDLSPPRRIDITLERIDAIVGDMPAEQRDRLPAQPWWSILLIVSRLRSMEMAERLPDGKEITPMADAYDRLVEPGENPVEALLRVFRAVYGRDQAEAQT